MDWKFKIKFGETGKKIREIQNQFMYTLVQLKIQHWFDVYYFEVCGFVALISTIDQCEQILKRGKTKQNQYIIVFVKSKIKVLFGIFIPKRAAFSRSALVLASSSVCSGTICKLELKRISFFVRLKIKYYGKKSLKKKNRETENYI